MLKAVWAAGSLTYMVATPGLASEHNATTFLLADVPQPDINLRILPECGGKTAIVGKYLSGPPELLVEICFTSAAYDLHQKFDLYEEAGVQEYLAIVLGEKQIRWYTLEDSRYEVMQPGTGRRLSVARFSRSLVAQCGSF